MGHFLILILIALTSNLAARAEPAQEYCGCLLFVDDAKSFDDFDHFKNLPISSLTRSWYRFGEQDPSKAYKLRKNFVEQLKQRGTLVGGGGSLSVLNALDLEHADFDTSWLSRNLDGTTFKDGEKKYGSISIPAFRSYLISKMLEQVDTGITELHLGESNGSVRFDDFTLGIKGNDGFIQWVRNKYSDKPKTWWRSYLGNLGVQISNSSLVSRASFQNLTFSQQRNFEFEWGKNGTWNGENRDDQPAFLAYKYAKNLDSFIEELRFKLSQRGYRDVKIDVWGFSDWMLKMRHRPDAFMSSPPDSRWGLTWTSDETGEFEKYEPRLRALMEEDIRKFSPTPVVYLIDHPRPFQSEFVYLSDERQAYLTERLARLTWNIGANFIFRSYSNEYGHLGEKTKHTIRKLCADAAKSNICPKR